MFTRRALIKCVNEAKYLLIEARILKQEATLIRDFSKKYPNHLPTGSQPTFIEGRAKASRLLARVLLKKAEKINGKLFLEGVRKPGLYPLTEILDGKNFKSWNTYRFQYENSIFEGVDPT